VSDALVGDTLERLRVVLAGRYELEREIGRGGMAAVYLARDPRHDRPVALKVLRPELSASLGADRFLREIKVAAQLQHPNILALYDSGEADGLLYYVMPFVEGESLRAKLDREKQLGLEEAIQLTREVADALGYAHAHGVIHRDIKPENILLSGGHALVADFGIARALSAAGADKLTETGMAVGTPYYMSPEQAMGGHDVDGRSDIYSLGCVFYELLAGMPPFTGPTPMSILARHSLEQVPSLQVVRQSIPDAVEAATMRALEKVPADRFRTMAEFSEALRDADLDRVSRRTPVRAFDTREVPAASPFRKRRGRAAVLWGAAAAVLVLAAGGIAASRHWGRSTGSSAPGSDLSPDHIAVLYFRNQTGQDSLNFLADGITEALIHQLSEVKQLQVISRNGVAPYKKLEVPPDSVARALKVGTIVEGGVAQSGNRLRVNVSLINAAAGTEIGSKVLERPREEIFALQDDLAGEVSHFLRERLGQQIQLQALRTGTRNTKAWELLQQASKLNKDVEPLLAAGDTAAAARRMAEADSLLAGAERVDPEWITPPIERGWIAYHETDLVSSFDKAIYSKWTARGLEHADRALKLKADDPDALELKGTLQYLRWLLNLEPDQTAAKKLLTGAEQNLRTAVAAKPTAAWAWTVLSHLLLGQSQTAEAKLAAVRSYEADPYLSTAKQTLYRLYSTSFDLEDRVEAQHWCEEGHRRFPDYYRFTECRLGLKGMEGEKPDIAKAWQLAEEFVRVSPPNLRTYHRLYGQMLLAQALVRAGLPDSARAVAVRSRGDATVDPTHDLAYYEAMVRAQLGDKDEAFRLLSTYIAANPQMRSGLAKDESWQLRELRSDPRFATMFGSAK
jgi:serine/threonine protein kinase/tetratricopeptide (TPR) repeat protein